MRKYIVKLLAIAGLCFSIPTLATTPQDILKQYQIQAKQEDAKFTGFSVERGKTFFHSVRTHSNGKTVSCATCHTEDPRQPGKTRANKIIEPMAPIVNPQRFTDAGKVEKWFGRNCKDVLERTCSLQEKGDYIQYLLSIK